MLSFGEPRLLLLLALAALMLYIYKRYQRSRKESALKFSSLGIIKKSLPRNQSLRAHIPFALLLVSLVLIITGLADPRIPLKTAKEGVNVVLVIDDSGSMVANDYQPTRLEAAKDAARILIKSLKPKDNVGIVIFESGATTASYLTPLKDKALSKLTSIEQKQGRTALGDGLSLAIDMANSIPNKKKVVILLSDGVNNAGVVSPDEAIQFAATSKIQVQTVGLGSVQPVVLGYDMFGNPQYAELDEATLKKIAQQTGGKYYKSVNKDTLDDIYRDIGEGIERELEDTSIKDWFFAAALSILALTMYIIYGKYKIII